MHDDHRMAVMTLTRESLLLIGICIADLASTLLLLQAGVAREGNPLMSYYLRHGIGVFVMVKLSLVFFPIFIAEWCKQYKPKFVRFMLRATIAAYLGAYLLVFLGVNNFWRASEGEPIYLPPPPGPMCK